MTEFNNIIQQSLFSTIDSISRGQDAIADHFNFSEAEQSLDLRPMTLDEQIEAMNQLNADILSLDPRIDALFETKNRLGL